MKAFTLLLFPIYIFASSFLTSSVPLPKTYVQNLDVEDCSDVCLEEMIAHGQVFSFLAHVQDKIDNKELNEERLMFVSLFNLGMPYQSRQLRIAMLLPYKVIGRYAASTTNASFSFLLAKNRAFDLKTFLVESESIDDIETALMQINKEQFAYVIAPLTLQGAKNAAEVNPNLNIYFPTINKKDLNTTSPFLFYGGIDYQAQIEALLQEATTPLVIFYDSSKLGKSLKAQTEESYFKIYPVDTDEENITQQELEIDEFDNQQMAEDDTVIDEFDEEPKKISEVISYPIKKRDSNLEKQLKENEKVQNGSFFLNTPVIKSGMVMSQLTLYDINVTNTLSTQINYDPLLLSITQYQDRENMIIANSINTSNNVMIETNIMLNNDIVYDWINYATTIGTDLFYHMITKSPREYSLKIEDRQIKYPIRLLQPSKSRFIPYVRPQKIKTQTIEKIL